MRGAVLRCSGEDNQAVAVAIEADAVVGGTQDGCCLADISGDAVDVVKPLACAHGIIQRTRVAEVVSGVVVCIERQFFRIDGDMFALRDVQGAAVQAARQAPVDVQGRVKHGVAVRRRFVAEGEAVIRVQLVINAEFKVAGVAVLHRSHGRAEAQ